MCLILLCPHQPRYCPLNFFMWDLRSMLAIYPLPDYHITTPTGASLFIFFFSPPVLGWPLQYFSVHVTSTFKLFVFLILKGSSLDKSLFSKNIQETRRCKVWLDNITSHFFISYSESLIVGVCLPVCTKSSTLRSNVCKSSLHRLRIYFSLNEQIYPTQELSSSNQGRRLQAVYTLGSRG